MMPDVSIRQMSVPDTILRVRVFFHSTKSKVIFFANPLLSEREDCGLICKYLLNFETIFRFGI